MLSPLQRSSPSGAMRLPRAIRRSPLPLDESRRLGSGRQSVAPTLESGTEDTPVLTRAERVVSAYRRVGAASPHAPSCERSARHSGMANTVSYTHLTLPTIYSV